MRQQHSIHELNDTRGSRIIKWIISGVLILYSLIAIYLIGLSFLNAFKTRQDLINNTMGWPVRFVLDNFKTVLVQDNFMRNLINSLILVGLSLVLLILVSSSLSYKYIRHLINVQILVEHNHAQAIVLDRNQARNNSIYFVHLGIIKIVQ